MKTRITEYKNFGRVYEITNGDMVAMVTIDIGPRIIYYGTADYNLMFEDTERLSCRGGEYFDANFGEGKKWYNLGGHRLWKSPEDLASYSIDDTEVIVEERNSGVVFKREVEKTTGLIKEIEIEALDNNKLRVEHRFTNSLNTSQEVAIWALTVLRPNGKIIVPLNENNKGFLPARNYVYWSYSNYNDKRFNVYDNYVSLDQSNTFGCAFKFGMFVEKGVAGYLVDDMLFSKTFDVNATGYYPDYGCNFESFTNDRIIECETLGELIEVGSNETISHTELWQFEKLDNISVEQANSILLSR